MPNILRGSPAGFAKSLGGFVLGVGRVMGFRTGLTSVRWGVLEGRWTGRESARFRPGPEGCDPSLSAGLSEWEAVSLVPESFGCKVGFGFEEEGNKRLIFIWLSGLGIGAPYSSWNERLLCG